MKNLVVMQSGGPTAVINASLVGVIESAKKSEKFDKVLGSINGINGILNNNFIDLKSLSDEDLKLVKVTPGAYLGSARHHLPEEFLDYKYNLSGEYTTIYKNVKDNDIGYIVIIGGNDSMDTVDKLNKFFKGVNLDVHVIGVPKTIDNDLVVTDHTPGYGSALKFIATQISEIKVDTSAYAKGRVTIVEIMGRDSGWLTAGAKLASLNGLGPDLIYLPEVPFSINKFLQDVKKVYETKDKVLIAVSEGIRDENGRYIISSYSYNAINDVFGHQQLGGTSIVLAEIVKNRLGYPVRSMELNLSQRCASHILSKTDLDEAYACGEFAANKVVTTTGKFITMRREDSKEYKIGYELVNVSDVANKVKVIPSDWIINGNDVNDKFIEYAKPLIEGEVEIEYVNGLPKYIIR